MHQPAPMPDPWSLYVSAWETFRERLSSFMGVQLIFYGAIIAIYIVVGLGTFGSFFLLRGNPIAAQVVQNFITGVVGVVILWLNAGLFRFHLAASRGVAPAFETVFKEHRLVPNYFLLNAAATVVALVAYIPGAAVIGPLIYGLIQADVPWQGVAAIGMLAALVYFVLLTPILLAVATSALFLIDRDLDPIAAVVAALRAVRPYVGWSYYFAFVSLVVGLALGVIGGVLGVLTCGYGALLVFSYLILVQCEFYGQLATRLEAQLRGPEGANPSPADVSAQATEQGSAPPEGAAASPLTAEGGGNPNPYAPPRADVELIQAAGDGLQRAAPVPAGCQEFRGPPVPSGVGAAALAFLAPWVVAGGNPFSGAVIGFQLGRQLGMPNWLGGLAGGGGLMACGLAAFATLLVGYRGRRRVVVDLDGFAVDRTPFWGGSRLGWSALASFRTSGVGVELRPRGLWGWIWRPVVPTQERETHDLVALLEEAGVPRT